MLGSSVSRAVIRWCVVCAAVTLASTARADITIGFEGYAHGTEVDTQYSGLGIQFSGGPQIYTVGNYEHWLYPPRSGEGGLVDEDWYFRLDAVGSLWESVSLWYWAFGTLELKVYDSNDFLLDSVQLNANYGSHSQVTIARPNIAYATVMGGGNYFIIDDLSVAPTSTGQAAVPAPGAALLVWLGLGLLGRLRRRLL